MGRKQTMFRAMLLNGGGGGIPSANKVLDLDPSLDVYSNVSGTTPQTTDGGSVARWNDQSSYTYAGNPLYAQQSDSSEQPLFYNSDSNRNNKPYLYFDGSDRWFTMEPYSGAYQMPEMSIYFVNQPQTPGNNGNGWMVSKTDSYYWDDGFTFVQQGDEDVSMTVADDGSDSNFFVDGAPVGNVGSIYSYTFKGAASSVDRVNAHRHKIGSASISSRVNGTTNALDLSGWFSSQKMMICGGRDLSGNEVAYMAWVGRVYRVLVYDTCHSESEQSDIMTELSTIYNI